MLLWENIWNNSTTFLFPEKDVAFLTVMEIMNSQRSREIQTKFPVFSEQKGKY